MIVHNVKVVVIGGCMEKKQWKGMALAILGCPILGAFRHICTIPRKCKAYQCGVATRSAFAHSRYIDDRDLPI